MPWLGRDIAHILLARTAYGKMMVQASHSQGPYVLLVVPVSVRDHEDAVAFVRAEPRLHDNLCRIDLLHLMIRGCFASTASGRRPGQEQYDNGDDHQGLTCRGKPNRLVGTPVPH